MDFRYYLKSDIGTTHEQNQDGAFAGIAKTAEGKVFFGVVCDGMGGMADGGFASGYVIGAVRDWFERRLPELAEAKVLETSLYSELSGVISGCNSVLYERGVQQGAAMGTTMSLLIITGEKYFAVQLGDSRVYRRSGGFLSQVTRDHSYVMDMVDMGLMTHSEAISSKNRNILTRCIGCKAQVEADFYTGEVMEGDLFLISSDGFHGGSDPEAVDTLLGGAAGIKESNMKKCILSAIDQRKASGEKDNITALAVLTV